MFLYKGSGEYSIGKDDKALHHRIGKVARVDSRALIRIKVQQPESIPCHYYSNILDMDRKEQ